MLVNGAGESGAFRGLDDTARVKVAIDFFQTSFGSENAGGGGEESGGEAIGRKTGRGEDIGFGGTAAAGVDDMTKFFPIDGPETASVTRGSNGAISDGEAVKSGVFFDRVLGSDDPVRAVRRGSGYGNIAAQINEKIFNSRVFREINEAIDGILFSKATDF